MTKKIKKILNNWKTKDIKSIRYCYDFTSYTLMDELENTHSQDDEASSLKQFNDKTNNSISSVLDQNPYGIKLNNLWISLWDLWTWDKDDFWLNENLICSDWNTQYIDINGKKYLIKDRNDNTEWNVYKMWNNGSWYSPFFFIGNFSRIDGYWTLVRKDWYIYEWRFVVSNNRRIRYDWKLTFPNGNIYEWDFIDGEPITEKTEEYSPFKKKGTYTKSNWDKKIYRYYWKAMWRPYFINLKDNRTNENWANNRGDVISIIEKAQDQPTKWELSSWWHTTDYIETDSEYIFQTQNWKQLVIQKDKSDNKDREITNIINAIKYFYEEHDGKKLFALWDDLKYRYGKLGILFSTLLSNVSEKMWDSDFLDKNKNNKADSEETLQERFKKDKKATAKNLAKWLNCYYKSKES